MYVIKWGKLLKLGIIFKHVFLVSEKTQPITIKTINYSILFGAIIAVYSENHTKQINRSTLCGQDAELVIVEAGGTYRYH
jgi:hypothetical protein